MFCPLCSQFFWCALLWFKVYLLTWPPALCQFSKVSWGIFNTTLIKCLFQLFKAELVYFQVVWCLIAATLSGLFILRQWTSSFWNAWVGQNVTKIIQWHSFFFALRMTSSPIQSAFFFFYQVLISFNNIIEILFAWISVLVFFIYFMYLKVDHSGAAFLFYFFCLHTCNRIWLTCSIKAYLDIH